MLPIETQETIVANAFFDELAKTALFAPESIMGWRAGSAIAKQRHLAAKALNIEAKMVGNEKMVESTTKAFQEMGAAMPSSATKAIAAEGKKSKTLLGAASVLGLGALGLGYYQYKRDKENGQLAGNYPQVS